MTTRFPRIRRVVPGIGLVQLATRATTRREHEARQGLFNDLVEQGQLTLIRALVIGTQGKPGGISWAELRDLKRRNQGVLAGSAIAEIAMTRPLSDVITETLPRMGRSAATRDRYRLSLEALVKRVGDVKVEELEVIDWSALCATWGKSPSDWMHLRRAVSALLTKLLGSPHHEIRLRLLPKIPTVVENERVPDLSVDLFWKLVASTPAHVQGAYVALLLTGMRSKSEYLKCGRDHLMPATCGVRVPGTKTKKSAAVVFVEPEWWPYIDAAIPCPVRYKMLRLHWIRACVANGAGRYVGEPARYEGLRLHDLRHAMGQWATDANVSLARVKDALRHASLAMSERYARSAGSKAVAKAVGQALGVRPDASPVSQGITTPTKDSVNA